MLPPYYPVNLWQWYCWVKNAERLFQYYFCSPISKLFFLRIHKGLNFWMFAQYFMCFVP